MNIAWTSTKVRDQILSQQLDNPHFDAEKSNAALLAGFSRSFSLINKKVSFFSYQRDYIWARYTIWKLLFIQSLSKRGIHCSRRMRRSTQISLTMNEYELFHDFHYIFAAYMPGDDGLFELKNFVFDAAHHLMLIDTLTNGFDSEASNKATERFIFSRPIDFFRTSFPLDYFVFDRYLLFKNKCKKYILSYQDHLSTRAFDSLGEATIKMEDHQFLIVVEF